jgi:ATP-dependent Clp protease ATP-binding subunit ClpB
MTSNIGARFLLDGIDDEGNIRDDAEEMAMEELRGSFRPEFLNRLDEIIMFKPLTKDNLSGIINLLIEDINRRLSDRDIRIELTDAAIQSVIDSAYDPVYGARPLKRYIQKYIETLAARFILEDMVSEDQIIVIDKCGDGYQATVKQQ